MVNCYASADEYYIFHMKKECINLKIELDLIEISCNYIKLLRDMICFFILGKGDMIVIDSLNVKFIFVVVEYKLPTSW